jgi:threonine dehydrogenase-like Zn-dependent dehydrogenase
MRAVVTEAVGAIAVLERPEPPDPGQVVIQSRAVGICGSDYHFVAGELSDAAGGSQFPRVLGHEVAGTIATVGPGCRGESSRSSRRRRHCAPRSAIRQR